MEVVSDKTAWPGDDWGYLTFSSSSIKMTSSTFEVPTSVILSLGTVTRDATKFDNGGHINVEASPDGRLFWHSGTGDKFTFNIDFGSYIVDTFSFYCDCRGAMSLSLYDGEDYLGKAECEAFNGTGVLNLANPLTGLHEITIVMDSAATAWPGPDYGHITFSQSKIVMTSEVLALSSTEILSVGTVTRDATKFDNGGNVNVLPSTDGLYFWHSGNGDKFTFDVDFGSYEVNKFKFNCAVRGPMSVKVYDGSDLIGEATCTEFVGDGICTLSKTLTGIKTITLELVTEATAWPGPDWGAIEFSYEEQQPINPNPSTADNSVILPIVVTMVITLGLIALKKKEN